MFISNCLALISVIICVGVASASNIAFFATSGSKSHKNVFQPLLSEMSRRGHTVTVFTAFAPKEARPGIHEVVLTAGTEMMKENEKMFLPGKGGETLSGFFNLLGATAELYCREAVNTPEVKNMLNGKVKYDLILLDHFFEDCGVAVAHKIKVPFIFISTSALMGQFANNLRYPYPIVHVPLLMTSYSDRMNFWERLNNLLMVATANFYREFIYVPKADAALRSLFGSDLPSILEMEKNMSMMLLNTHVSLNHPTPYLPHTKEVGGMHLREGKPLPKDLQEWMDGAGSDGVIYFSLGTVLPASQMDAKFRNLFLQAFSKLPQRVVWKWETGEMEGLPDNVRVFKFLPQQDILAHPATKVFITHGGLLSIQETVYHGVPVVGIPGGADQFFNMENMLSRKLGLKLTWDTITSEALLEALKTVIYNPSYNENVERASRVFKDQPSSPTDTAMFWIEFVIRHNGASHLRSAVLDLKWYEYHMVDIAVFLLSAFIAAFFVIYFLLRFIYRSLFSKSSPSKDKKKKRS